MYDILYIYIHIHTHTHGVHIRILCFLSNAKQKWYKNILEYRYCIWRSWKGNIIVHKDTPEASICKSGLQPRPNDLHSTRCCSRNNSPATPQRPPNHENLFAKLLSDHTPTKPKPPTSICQTALPQHPPRPSNHKILFAKLLSRCAPTWVCPRVWKSTSTYNPPKPISTGPFS